VDQFAQSQMIGVVQGWVPNDEFDTLKAAVKTKFGDKVEIGKLSVKDVDIHTIPTKLSNPKIFKPFEMILSLFTPATYGSMDPTKIVAISFILFYGFILGDAGYGLFIIAVACWARNKFSYNDFVSNAMTIAMWMGLSSVVFGVWFWEFFGNFGEYLIPFPGFPFFHRAHETNTYLYMAFAVGAFYIPLALLLGVKEGFAHGHTKHAIEKLGMLLGLASVGVFVATQSVPMAGLVFAAACALFIYSMGAMFMMGVIEIIGITANVLSYARLMALGMASIALADIANDLPDSLGPVIGVPAALLVHLANIGIGVFSPTIHSLRLNYVEFLPKFYETEGRDYQPFRKEMAW
jgi:V/A-type H+-transporting ATPase subunit I